MMKIYTMTDNLIRSVKRQAFTLIEILLVVVIIALIVSLGGTNYYRSYKRMLVKKTASDMALTVKYARLIALESNSECKLHLKINDSENTESGYYLIGRRKNTDTEQVISGPYTKPRSFDDSIVFEDIRIAPAGILQYDDDNTEVENVINFKPDGTADAAVIQLGDGKNHYTVNISSATGRAKVEFGEAKELASQVIDLDLIQ